MERASEAGYAQARTSPRCSSGVTMLRRCTLVIALLFLAICHDSVGAASSDSEAIAFSRKMGIGWNLGNTLEATGIKGTSVRQFETCWGNPVTTKEMFDGIKAAGFRSVRI